MNQQKHNRPTSNIGLTANIHLSESALKLIVALVLTFALGSGVGVAVSSGQGQGQPPGYPSLPPTQEVLPPDK